MMTLLLVASLPALPAAEPATHEARNPLYKSLIESGLGVGADAKVKFPAPTMPDGLDAAAQTAVIKKLIGNDYSYDDFTRNAVPAPHILKLRDVSPSDPKAPARGIDAWFIAYADLKALEDDKFLDRVAGAGGGSGKSKALTDADLAKRKIPAGNAKSEQFGHLEFDFLEKVHLKVTGRVVWTRTDDSVVVVGEIDPRFNGDPEFPNEWQSIIKEGGVTKLGPAQTWSSAAFYLKITKLAAPAGALFIEQHVIFAEPTGWFDGANLLRSKLPLVMTNNVRTMRKELLKTK
jgi:hypothetical protein